ncbi:hypothetical protein H920_16380 [Fukomys damarensis]|uniref:Uncharacterized protein n=1 Tax=Fukomys damarensis TaxID=885580 RepID=A0A091DHH9_FUKDA|nr:hypothetical protein H920_16380 [Fukomys damarensis]
MWGWSFAGSVCVLQVLRELRSRLPVLFRFSLQSGSFQRRLVSDTALGCGWARRLLFRSGPVALMLVWRLCRIYGCLKSRVCFQSLLPCLSVGSAFSPSREGDLDTEAEVGAAFAVAESARALVAAERLLLRTARGKSTRG